MVVLGSRQSLRLTPDRKYASITYIKFLAVFISISGKIRGLYINFLQKCSYLVVP